MKKTDRFDLSVPHYLKGKLEQKAEQMGCSQAEVLRLSFILFMEGSK